MGRRLYTDQQRERILLRSQEELKNKARRRQLFNYIYRRKPFFRFSVVFRAITFILSAYVLNLNTIFTTVARETLRDKRVEEFYIWRKTETNDHKDILLNTKEGNTYVVGFLAVMPGELVPGDTLNILRNIFGKTTYISKSGSDHLIQISKYRRLDNYLIFVCFISFLSLLFYDGYDYLYRITIWIVLIVDAAGILFYLFI